MSSKELVWPLDESQGPSQLHGHGHWLVCEVALSSDTTCGREGYYRIRVYLSFIQHQSPKIVCNMEVTFIVDLPSKLASKTPT
jgi:hypothetical protein